MMTSSLSYCPFADLGSTKKQKVNSDKLTASREKFAGVCKACGQPMKYVTGNIMICSSDSCQGIKKTRKVEDGSEIAFYLPSFRLLDDEGEHIAEGLFED